MLIKTPDEIKEFLYAGPLEYSQADLQYVLPSRGTATISAPEIGIGQPQWWDLGALTREQGKPLPPEMALMTHDADFFLVNLACSFRPTRASWVESASFTVYLRPKRGSAKPIAFDLYPRDVQEERSADIKVAISPSLKLNEVAEASLGSLDIAFQYKKLEPVITAFGLLESKPGWDFSRTSQQDIRGARFLYLIVKRPKEAEAVRATFELHAQVRIRQGLLGASIGDVAQDHLTALMCF